MVDTERQSGTHGRSQIPCSRDLQDDSHAAQSNNATLARTIDASLERIAGKVEMVSLILPPAESG